MIGNEIKDFFNRATQLKALVVGDLMLDEYLWGKTERISPEAPVAGVDVTRQDMRLGGAGNVINHLLSFACQVRADSAPWDGAESSYGLTAPDRSAGSPGSLSSASRWVRNTAVLMMRGVSMSPLLPWVRVPLWWARSPPWSALTIAPLSIRSMMTAAVSLRATFIVCVGSSSS